MPPSETISMQIYPLLHSLCFFLLFLSTKPLERLQHNLGQLAQRAKQRTEPETPPLDPDSVYEEVYQKIVRHNVHDEDTEIAPRIIRADVECRQVIVARTVWAVLAECR